MSTPTTTGDRKTEHSLMTSHAVLVVMVVLVTLVAGSITAADRSIRFGITILPPPFGTEVQQTFAAHDGGVMQTPAANGTSIAIRVPPMATGQRIELVIAARVRSDELVPTIPRAVAMIGEHVYDVRANVDGSATTEFAQAFTFTMHYREDQIPPGVPESSLRLMTNHGTGAWELVPSSTVDAVAHTITATVNRFSFFAIIGSPSETIVPPPTPESITPPAPDPTPAPVPEPTPMPAPAPLPSPVPSPASSSQPRPSTGSGSATTTEQIGRSVFSGLARPSASAPSLIALVIPPVQAPTVRAPTIPPVAPPHATTTRSAMPTTQPRIPGSGMSAGRSTPAVAAPGIRGPVVAPRSSPPLVTAPRSAVRRADRPHVGIRDIGGVAPTAPGGIRVSGKASLALLGFTNIRGAGIDLAVFSPEIITGTVHADAAGEWSWQTPKPLTPGKHTVYVTATDGGDTVVARASYQFEVVAPPSRLRAFIHAVGTVLRWPELLPGAVAR